LTAGLVAGLAAGVLNIVIYLVMIAFGGHDWSFLIVGSILIASLLPNLLAALAFFVLARLTKFARPIMTLGVVAFVLISVLPHLGIGPAPSPALAALPEGFDLLTVPLHLVFSLTAILLMPWLVKRRQAKGR
jgi:hypothetical protein